MKKIYFLFAAILGITASAQAQRHCDVEVLPLIGPADSSNYSCTSSVVSGYYMVNNGPDTIKATDTLIITDPNLDNTEVDPGYFAIYNAYPTGLVLNGVVDTVLAPRMDIAPGDTILYYQWNDTVTRLSTLINADEPLIIDENGDTVFNYVYTASGQVPPNGNYYWMAQFVRFRDGGGVVVVDTVFSNNAQLNYITLNCTTSGINDLNFNKVALNVYPNPASNTINFQYSFIKTTEVNARIMDLTGRTLKIISLGKASAGEQKFEVNISGLPKGTYLLEVTTDSSKGISKFTKD
jgi:hypothetical protein